MSENYMRVVYWGTYDTGKPRNRIMIRGLRKNGVEVIECHVHIWKDVEDKSQLSNIGARAKRILQLLISYPLLIYRYLRLPPHDFVVVAYMGQFDVLVLFFFARLRGVSLIWDVFISLYDTVVIDRKLLSKKSVAAFLLYAIEWLATRASTQVIMDTSAHAQYFEKLYRLPSRSVRHVYVGAELEAFKPQKILHKNGDTFDLLFYGQFIPLHGIDTIVDAAEILEKSEANIRWTVIGRGQEQKRIDGLIEERGLKSIERILWVPYENLVTHIIESDACLGIFAAGGKATRVIPNKVYQILAAGKPLITGDTPAIRELLSENSFLRLVPPGNSEALAAAVIDLQKALQAVDTMELNPNDFPRIGYVEIGNQFVEILKKLYNH
ncbi:glycosyltransferase [Thermodesulfobacteriota bacterium]